MERRSANVIYKYFSLTDEFVRVGHASPQELARHLEVATRAAARGPGGAKLDRANYRRAVLDACMTDWARLLRVALSARSGCDQAVAEELLYQICIEVNPALDIHCVQLPAEASDPTANHEALTSKPEVDWHARTQDLEARLGCRIVGQPQAVQRLTHRMRKHATGLGRGEGPLGAFFLVGNTGVGKTALAKALAELLFEDRSALVRIDCSEYASGHEYSKLIGAPPGYIGHEEGGQLTAALQNPGTKVLLFDEIEKAHPKLHQLLLQVLDEGRLTDGRGRVISFKDTLILLTSNVGTRDLHDAAEAVGFGGERCLEVRARQGLVENALKKVFPPEFLARLDDVLIFDDLRLEDCERIATLEIEKLRSKIKALGLCFRVHAGVARWIADRAWSNKSGAREIGRVVAREIEDPLAELFFNAKPSASSRVECSVRRGLLHLQIARPRKSASKAMS